MTDLEIIENALIDDDEETKAEEMAALLMDTDVSTYKMFDDLAILYINSSEEKREGIDRTLGILTGFNLAEIALEIQGGAN